MMRTSKNPCLILTFSDGIEMEHWVKMDSSFIRYWQVFIRINSCGFVWQVSSTIGKDMITANFTFFFPFVIYETITNY